MGLTLSPLYQPVPPSVAPPLTARKPLPRFPFYRLIPADWPPAKTMCLDNSTYCAHKTITLHTQTLTTMFTNNYCACQSFPFTDIRLVCSILVVILTSFFQVLTCFNGCVAARDARLGFGTRLRWFCDWSLVKTDILRQLWAPETMWINLIGMSVVNSDSSDTDSASVAMSLTATILWHLDVG